MTRQSHSNPPNNSGITAPCATLLADIGGTHLRFCLSLENGVLTPPRIYEWQEKPNLLDLIARFLSEEALSKNVSQAVLACAGPEPTADAVFMLNVGRQKGSQGYTFSQQRLRQAFGLKRLLIVNDYRTIALSLEQLTPENLVQVGQGISLPLAPKAVIGPGTGCNMAVLLSAQHESVALVGEGGHTVFSPVGETEAAIAQLLEKKYPPYLWMERLISGHGILEIYHALCQLRSTPGNISSLADLRDRALNGSCALCAESLSIFCEMLGTAAANTALIFGARGGIYISGGVVPRFLPFFQKSGFRQRFESIGTQVGFLKEVPTFVITHPTASLLGAQTLALKL